MLEALLNNRRACGNGDALPSEAARRELLLGVVCKGAGETDGGT